MVKELMIMFSKYVLQIENDYVDIDVRIVEDLIRGSRRNINYCFSTTQGLKDLIDLNEYLPIGNLDFVTKWLTLVYGINNINPIEIPKSLRKYEFLKREYSIVKGSEIPKSGTYFIKDASHLKNFSYCGDMSHFDFDKNIKENDLYVLSEYVRDIYAEYRVYVLNGSVESIVQYDGEPMDFAKHPIDVALLNKAVVLYNLEDGHAKSYTIDIMVTESGTAIIEMHPFISIGLYATVWGDNLLKAYEDGIKYVKQNNLILEIFSVKSK